VNKKTNSQAMKVKVLEIKEKHNTPMNTIMSINLFKSRHARLDAPEKKCGSPIKGHLSRGNSSP